MEWLHTAASLLKDHPDYRAPDQLTQRVRAVIAASSFAAEETAP